MSAHRHCRSAKLTTIRAPLRPGIRADRRRDHLEQDVLGSYNAHAVATEDQIVMAAEITDEHHDHAQLHPMIAATNDALNQAGIAARPGQLLTDAGYCSGAPLAEPVTTIRTASSPPATSAAPEPRAPGAAARRRHPGRQDGPQGVPRGRTRPPPEAPAHHRARVRAHQRRPRRQTFHAPRNHRRRQRVEALTHAASTRVDRWPA